MQFVIARDPGNVFQFCALQSAKAHELLAPFNFDYQTLSTVVLLKDGKFHTQSTAVLHIVKELRGLWGLLYVFIFVPRVLRDGLYDIVTRFRYAIFGKRSSCSVPSGNLRERFIDAIE